MTSEPAKPDESRQAVVGLGNLLNIKHAPRDGTLGRGDKVTVVTNGRGAMREAKVVSTAAKGVRAQIPGDRTPRFFYWTDVYVVGDPPKPKPNGTAQPEAPLPMPPPPMPPPTPATLLRPRQPALKEHKHLSTWLDAYLKHELRSKTWLSLQLGQYTEFTSQVCRRASSHNDEELGTLARFLLSHWPEDVPRPLEGDLLDELWRLRAADHEAGAPVAKRERDPATPRLYRQSRAPAMPASQRLSEWLTAYFAATQETKASFDRVLGWYSGRMQALTGAVSLTDDDELEDLALMLHERGDVPGKPDLDMLLAELRRLRDADAARGVPKRSRRVRNPMSVQRRHREAAHAAVAKVAPATPAAPPRSFVGGALTEVVVTPHMMQDLRETAKAIEMALPPVPVASPVELTIDGVVVKVASTADAVALLQALGARK